MFGVGLAAREESPPFSSPRALTANPVHRLAPGVDYVPSSGIWVTVAENGGSAARPTAT
jgi:hypothetical protein